MLAYNASLARIWMYVDMFSTTKVRIIFDICNMF